MTDAEYNEGHPVIAPLRARLAGLGWDTTDFLIRKIETYRTDDERDEHEVTFERRDNTQAFMITHVRLYAGRVVLEYGLAMLHDLREDAPQAAQEGR